MKTAFYKSHRWFARILALPVILWALSGILHPFMANWSKPEIAHRFLRPQPIPAAVLKVDIEDVLKRHAIDRVDNLHMKQIDGQWYYQIVHSDGTNDYYSIRTGEAAPEAEDALVQQLALGYTGYSAEQITEIERITEFRTSYRFINRLLPAYRVRFDTDNSFEVYVDPVTGKLATYSNATTRIQKALFAHLHTWYFLGNESSPLRVTLVCIFIALALWVGASGVYIWAFLPSTFRNGSKRKMRKDRYFHRLIGIVTALFYIMTALSGLTHVLKKYTFDWGFMEAHHPVVETTEFQHSLTDSIAQIKQPVHDVALARIDGKAYYRLSLMSRETPDRSIYANCDDGTILEDGDARYASELAIHFSESPAAKATQTKLTTSFTNQYGFIYKRLPVQVVKLTNSPYLSIAVDTPYAHLSKRTKPSDIAEALIFINLHKFHFVDPISKEVRDWLTVIVCVLILLTSALGVSLWLRKRKK
ncbi:MULTISPECIES: PepSY-associated TM helix domain-containing protein [unclassified Lentimonas]|uniref:PepSY-associated TM helix domain-containing protein n=1 Tax=unclassified Lentimonas TaxID=2630993 RepID=UPI001329A301|nr:MULTISPECIES: PepSY-associated TM helix domain-containing protein [unclassified Lentimonas]CAA6679233.1 Unannotated [Lentimonas sp. CC4]CAA6685897.1 Unannotated [Lentimonas sp. CC6]CAA7076012.1 Unannotated [Lentimonas sp. CC4]CAA7168556.1 Unannotated [Lentimonas sp. CC21]CAA7180949.1 Unannotated [Lentimonas sp. CC8]